MISNAETRLNNKIVDSGDILTITNGELTSFRTSIGLGSDSNVATLISNAESRLNNKIVDSGDILTITNDEITSFRTSIGLGSDSSVTTLISNAESRLNNKIVDSGDILTITNGELTSFRTSIGLGSDSSVATIISDVREEITNLVILDSNNVGSITDTKLVAFRNNIGLGSDSSVGTLITDVKNEISSIVTIDSAGIATIAQKSIDSFETQLIGADGAVGQIATAQAGLSQRITANSDSLQTISQKYFVALDDGNTFTGFEVINGDSVSSFTVQADDFKIVNGTNSSVNPFSVNTTTNKVEMTNAQVTGNLDIGDSGSAGMRITDTTITIHDGTRARVILGELP